MIETKFCKKCNTPKSFDKFYKTASACKICHTRITDEWHRLHPKKSREWSARYKKNNKEKVRLASILRKEKRKILHEDEDRKKKEEYDKTYYLKNIDRINARMGEYYLLNRDKYRAYAKAKRMRDMKDPKAKLHRNIACAVYLSLVGNKRGRNVFKLLGYPVEELQRHMESLFDNSMTWENYGRWHIDHKVPISAFNFTTPEDIDFKRCWALSNLQPLWRLDNIKKGDTLSIPFQPSLALYVKEVVET